MLKRSREFILISLEIRIKNIKKKVHGVIILFIYFIYLFYLLFILFIIYFIFHRDKSVGSSKKKKKKKKRHFSKTNNHSESILLILSENKPYVKKKIMPCVKKIERIYSYLSWNKD